MVDIPEDVAALPITVVNRFSVFAGPTHLCVAFGSQWSDKTKTHHHFVAQLSNSDARWLADLIEKQILEAETKGTQP